MAVSFMLAPMAELSHRALRELIERFGSSPEAEGAEIPGDKKTAPNEYFTEMISAGAFLSGGPFEKWYADNGPCPEKLVYQLVSGDADHIVRAAALLSRNECLGIDINMGCSAPAITRTGAGVRWMADPGKAAILVRRTREQTRRRLSVKLRIGLEDNFEYLVHFCRCLEEEGIDLITLHPRTAKEKFKRKARWDYVSALRKELRVPLAGNGDIASAEEMLRRSGEHGAVMIGRLAVRRPWVFHEARLLETNNRRGPATFPKDKKIDLEETGFLFLELLSRYQPPEFHETRAKLFFSYFCDNLKWGNHVKNLLNRKADLAGMERAWRNYFREGQEEKYAPFFQPTPLS